MNHTARGCKRDAVAVRDDDAVAVRDDDACAVQDDMRARERKSDVNGV